jgi:L-lactate dehydrogenase (cytochrome)
MDGGIRSGQDVCKALCIGAQGVLIGRPFLYGLGAYGKQGVTKCLEIMRDSLDESLGFIGENNVQDLGRNNILYRSYNEGFLD